MIPCVVQALILSIAATVASGTLLPPDPQPPAANPPAAPPGMDQMPQDMQHMMAMGPKGTLAIRGTQGTAGGPAVGSDEVEIILIHEKEAVKQIKSRLDENGIAMISDIPVGIAVQPVVRIKHAGVLFQETGPVMDANTPRASMNITVFEVTDEMPTWKVLKRQVMAARLPTELDVVEVVTVENMGDKTWLGAPATSEGRRDTVVLGVPESADKFNLEGGFHGWCCTSYAASSLHVQMPLMPGKTTYRFSYTVPITDGKADLRVSSAVPADQTTIIVPDDGSPAEPQQVTASGSDTVQGTRVRLFKASNLPAGQMAGVLLTGLVQEQQAAAATPARTVPSDFPLALWVGSGVVVLAFGGVFMWMRARRRLSAGLR